MAGPAESPQGFATGTAAFLSDGRLVVVEIVRDGDRILLVVFRHAEATQSVVQQRPDAAHRQPVFKPSVRTYAGTGDNVVLMENDRVVATTGFTQKYPAFSEMLKTKPILADLLRELKANRRDFAAATR